MKKLFFLVLGFGLVSYVNAQHVAVITDAEVAQKADKQLKAYTSMLKQKEGLNAAVFSRNWKNPDEVKAVIDSFRKNKPAFEGIVLIGNVPVVLVRNAQHMTTAFKMDEDKFPFEQSSVASDRFYDDPDLKFNFIRQDAERPLWFYYELDPKGPQTIRSDFYTGRILSWKNGDERIREIATYLEKAVAARETENPFDSFLSFFGSGYNSESFISWANEQVIFREILPQVFKTGDQARFLHFRQADYMKYRIFSELQRPGLDMVLFTEHGDIKKQYINNSPLGNDEGFAYNLLQYSVRNAIRRAASRGQDPALVIENYKKTYGFPDSWFKGALDNDSLRIADSAYIAQTNILSQDLAAVKPEARVAIFNACYNGSFHHPESIAGSYIFGSGKTLVAHGNTVNVLQDKWTIEHMGLIGKGARIGTWAMYTNTLESALSGDPTWRFSAPGSSALQQTLHAGRKDAAAMRKLVSGNDPVMAMVAMRNLFDLKVSGLPELLSTTYRSSQSASVRMECVRLLSLIGGPELLKTAPLALNDSYELIRRKTSEWLAKAGHEELIRPLVKLLISRPDDERVMFQAERCLELFDWNKVEEAYKAEAANASFFYDADTWLKNRLARNRKAEQYARNYLATILDPTASENSRIQGIRLFRNNTYHSFVPELLPLIKDKNESAKIRQNLIEALGWFYLSYQKPLILNAVKEVSMDASAPEEVRLEAIQTLARLNEWWMP